MHIHAWVSVNVCALLIFRSGLLLNQPGIQNLLNKAYGGERAPTSMSPAPEEAAAKKKAEESHYCAPTGS